MFSYSFKLSTLFMFAMNVLLFVPAVIETDVPDILISSCTILVLFLVFMVRKWFGRKLQYLTIFALFSYILGRILLIKSHYSTSSKISLFFQGYGFAAVQFIIISRFTRFTHQVCAAAILLALRVTIVYAYIDPSAFRGITLARQIVIDTFMVIMLYSTEKNNRDVFKIFYNNREELVKFKELLADSLPQAITIVALKTLRPLFANNAFLNTFQSINPEDERSVTVESSQSNNSFLANMAVDPKTAREIGIVHSDFQALNILDEVVNLEQVVKFIIQKELFTDKAISVSALHGIDEKQRSFEITLKRIKWDAEDAVAIILNDITYQENLIALKVSNKNKDKILATVSHELRTPLHGIINLLELTEKKLSDHEALENLSLCKDNAILLLSLVNSILDLHQISTDKLKLNITKFDLREYLSSTLRLFQFQCHQKGLALEFQVSDRVPVNIITDADRLNEILINLVGNAFKFTMKGGIKIEVEVDLESPRRLRFAVIDTGIGIRESDQTKLFKIGGKLEDEASVNKHGVGLGLTISNALAAKLNGTEEQEGIHLISQYGEGSKFYFTILQDLNQIQQDQSQKHLEKLPSQLSERELLENSLPELSYREGTEAQNIAFKLRSYTMPEGVSSQELKPLAKKFSASPNKQVIILPGSPFRNQEENLNIFEIEKHKTKDSKPNFAFDHFSNSFILVVDDNPFNIMIAENLLKDLGVGVKSALGGSEAIEAVQQSYQLGENIKLILMDCQMPLMDGYETSRAFQTMMQKKEIPQIPIIAWTANNSKEDIQRCYDAGMIGYLPKPTSQKALTGILADLGLAKIKKEER